ncbi:MAG: DNA cytosine methyltransferase [Planctomycetia bacterium]
MVGRPPHQQFRFIDLFAGIGGFHLAMSQLGGECVFASEIDPDCRAVYEANFGLKPEGDIKPMTEGRVVQVPQHDVLCAGFPCQPFSKSGFQRGMDEARGTLFFNILRILEARRPRYAILENVRNIAGPRQRRTWDIIILELRALGYRVCGEPTVFSPHLLPPKQGGRPQVRDRVFILCEHIGSRDKAALEGAPLIARKPVSGWDPAKWRIADCLDDDKDIEGLERYRLRPDEVRWIDAWNEFLQGIDEDPLPGFPIWADAFVDHPRITTDTPEWKANWLQKNHGLYLRNRKFIDRWRTKNDIASFPESRRKLEWQARGHAADLWQLAMHLRPSGIRAKPATYLPALVAITQTSIIGPRRRRITPREAARLQGVPDDYVLHEDDATAYKQLGNAVNVGAVMYATSRLFEAGTEQRDTSPYIQSPSNLSARTAHSVARGRRRTSAGTR